jgi:hypothetical protein
VLALGLALSGCAGSGLGSRRVEKGPWDTQRCVWYTVSFTGFLSNVSFCPSFTRSPPGPAHFRSAQAHSRARRCMRSHAHVHCDWHPRLAETLSSRHMCEAQSKLGGWILWAQRDSEPLFAGFVRPEALTTGIMGSMAPGVRKGVALLFIRDYESWTPGQSACLAACD